MTENVNPAQASGKRIEYFFPSLPIPARLGTGKQRFHRPGAACPLLRLHARVRSPGAQGLGPAGRLLFYQGLASQPFGAEMEQNRYARDGAEEAEQGRKARALHDQSPHHGKKTPAA